VRAALNGALRARRVAVAVTVLRAWARISAEQLRAPRRLLAATRRLCAASLARATRAWAREVTSIRWRRRAAEVGLARTLRRGLGVALWRWSRRPAAEREEWANSSLKLSAAAVDALALTISRLHDSFCQACIPPR
jgi:hypothetical protein